jgi:hypothetical protein
MKCLLTILCFLALQASGQALFHAHNQTAPAPAGPVPTAWYKASVGVTLNGSNEVTGWADQSGNGNHLSVTSGAAAGLYSATAHNSHPGVGGNGTNRSLSCASFTESFTQGTLIVVCKTLSDPPATDAQTGGAVARRNIQASTHYPYLDGVIYENWGNSYFMRKSTIDPTTSLAQMNVYAVSSSASLWANYLNGSVLYSTATTSPGFSDTGFYVLSANNPGTHPYYFNGWVLEIRVYPVALTATQIQTITTELQAQYGL